MFCKHNLFYSRLLLYKNFKRYKRVPIVADLTNPKNEFRKGQVNFFMDILGLNRWASYDLLLNNVNLRQLEPERVRQAVFYLQKYGFTLQDIKLNPQMLTVLPISIEQHTMILQEAGFVKITPSCINNYVSIVKKKICLLKAHHLIPDNINVPENLASHFNMCLTDVESISQESDQRSLSEIRCAILRQYLIKRLEMTEHEANHLFKTYTRIKNKSFRLMVIALKQLELDFGFTKDRIKRNGYLIHSNPENSEKLLTDVKELGGLDIRTVINRYPKVLMTNYETLIKTSQHLQSFNIPNETIQKCFEIFTLSSQSVYDRMMDLKAVPEFKALCSHPRVLRLIHYQKKALIRLNYLQQLRVKCASLHILSASREHFERYAREGADKTKGKDIMSFLETTLDFKDVNMRDILNRHPYWCHVPLVAVETTLRMLRRRQFNDEHLINNLHILLYPVSLVQKTLNPLQWTRTHSDLPHIKDVSKLSKNQQLSLCLYLIEREHHFTGNGVWDEVTPSRETPVGNEHFIPPLPEEYAHSSYRRYGLNTQILGKPAEV